VNDSENPNSKLSRRTIIGAAAWSAPVVALSVASPAAAASTKPLPPNPVPAVAISNKARLEEFGTGAGFYVAYAVPTGIGDGYTTSGLIITATYDVPTSTPGGATGEVVTVSLPPQLVFKTGGVVKTYTPDPNSWPNSVVLNYDEIRVPWGTPAGNYTITVTYMGKTDTVTVKVGTGGQVFAWGSNSRNQAYNTASNFQTSPAIWGGGAGFSVSPPAFTDYGTLASSGVILAAQANNFSSVGRAGYGTNVANGVRRLADGIADSIVNTNKGTAVDAIFYWKGGTLRATGTNSGDHMSLGDGTAYNGAGSAKDNVQVGVKILEANPGLTIKSFHSGSDIYRAAYILSDGTVWNSGANTSYAMGIGLLNSGQFLASQTVVTGGAPLTKVVSVAVGDTTTLFLDSDGNLWGAGTPNSTEGPLPGLNPGYGHEFATPVGLPNGNKVKKIWGAGQTYIVQDVNNDIWFTGENASSRASIGNSGRARSTWRQSTVAAGKTVADLVITNNACMWRMTDGTVYFSGNGGNYGLANGTNPVTVATMTLVNLSSFGSNNVIDIAATYGNSYSVLMR